MLPIQLYRVVGWDHSNDSNSNRLTSVNEWASELERRLDTNFHTLRTGRLEWHGTQWRRGGTAPTSKNGSSGSEPPKMFYEILMRRMDEAEMYLERSEKEERILLVPGFEKDAGQAWEMIEGDEHLVPFLGAAQAQGFSGRTDSGASGSFQLRTARCAQGHEWMMDAWRLGGVITDDTCAMKVHCETEESHERKVMNGKTTMWADGRLFARCILVYDGRSMSSSATSCLLEMEYRPGSGNDLWDLGNAQETRTSAFVERLMDRWLAQLCEAPTRFIVQAISQSCSEKVLNRGARRSNGQHLFSNGAQEARHHERVAVRTRMGLYRKALFIG